MSLELIACVGVLLHYLNFLIHKAGIFDRPRKAFTNALNKGVASDKWGAKFVKDLFECNLCNNFWITLVICLLFSLPLYLPLTAPVITYILYKLWPI